MASCCRSCAPWIAWPGSAIDAWTDTRCNMATPATPGGHCTDAYVAIHLHHERYPHGRSAEAPDGQGHLTGVLAGRHGLGHGHAKALMAYYRGQENS